MLTGANSPRWSWGAGSTVSPRRRRATLSHRCLSHPAGPGLPTQDGDGDTATGWQQMPPLGCQQRAGDRTGGQGWGPPPASRAPRPSAFHPFVNPQIATSQGDANKGHFYCHLRPRRARRPTNLLVTQTTRRWGFGAVLLGFGFRSTGTPLSPRPDRRLLSQKGLRSSCTQTARYCRGTSTNLRRPPTTP